MIQLKNILSFSLMFFLTFLVQDAFAQHRQDGNLVEKLKTQIELTAEQDNELQVISDKYQSQVKALKENIAERDANRSKIKSLRRAQRAEVMAVLTPEQQATLNENKAKHRAERKEKWSQVDKKVLKSELKTYRQQKIKPVIATQRAKLETQLSAADRATLANLRPVFKEMKSAHKADKKERKQGEAHPTHEERETQRQQLEEKYANEIATLKSLVEKYNPQIDALRTEIEPQMQQWSIDTKTITKKYLSDANIQHPPHKKGKGHHGKKQDRMGKDLHGEHAKAHFLLLDPTETNTANSTATTTLSVYPNPLVSNGQVKYQVKNAGNIHLELRDESGNVVKLLVNDYKKIGTYTVDISVQNARNGAYYLFVTDSQGTASKALVVTQ